MKNEALNHNVNGIFALVEDLNEMKVNERDIFVSYAVVSLFTNVPVDETTGILAEKVCKHDWFHIKEMRSEHHKN